MEQDSLYGVLRAKGLIKEPSQGKFRQATSPKQQRQHEKWNRDKRQPPSAKLPQ